MIFDLDREEDQKREDIGIGEEADLELEENYFLLLIRMR